MDSHLLNHSGFQPAHGMNIDLAYQDTSPTRFAMTSRGGVPVTIPYFQHDPQ